MDILTEEELKQYESLNYNPSVAEVIAKLIASNRLTLSANAELSFKKNAYKKALSKIVCLNIPMPDEVFNLANNALEELK